MPITTGIDGLNRGVVSSGHLAPRPPDLPSAADAFSAAPARPILPSTTSPLSIMARLNPSLVPPRDEAERTILTARGLSAAIETATLLRRAASELLRDGEVVGRQIEDVMDPGLQISKVARFASLVRVLTGRHALSVLSQISDLYEELFFLDIVPAIYEDTKRILAAKAKRSGTKQQEMSRAIEDIETGLFLLKTYRDILTPLAQQFLLTLYIGSLLSDADGLPISDSSNPTVDHFCGLEHDIRNLSTALVHIPQLARSETIGTFRSILKINEFNLSEAGALLSSVAGLLSHEASRRCVHIAVIPNVARTAIPAHLQRSLFRLIFELALNGLRNTDETKPERERVLRLEAVEYENALHFIVTDAGVGMGAKRPGRIIGTGRGIAVSIAYLKRKHGLSVEFQSLLGIGTTVNVSVPNPVMAGISAALPVPTLALPFGVTTTGR